ncbi:substrate-binding domain-containing protein [Paracoccus mutanolyticus]|uniref:hypothetical protein n=1 Tax=Paracoccus mutanolyticus TaxID=1499308 RepID=UPI00294FF8CE|nr:hypothetical protein [Paracoccus mutanolyticus]
MRLWVLFTMLVALAMPAGAAPRRVVSINLCTDQLALAVAAPGQLVSVSELARDPALSAMASRAAAIPSNRGRAEEVLALRPDLVLASSLGDAATVRLLHGWASPSPCSTRPRTWRDPGRALPHGHAAGPRPRGPGARPRLRPGHRAFPASARAQAPGGHLSGERLYHGPGQPGGPHPGRRGLSQPGRRAGHAERRHPCA